jgi:RND family efflux transporter MFP subunit
MGGATRAPHRGVASLALALSLAGCRSGEERSPAAAEQQPVVLAPENVAVVESRTLSSGPEISGTLRARREASIRAEVGGTVLRIHAEAGERVRAGQVLARIDAAALRDGLLAARSGVTGAESSVQVARANAKRARTLADAGAFAPQQAEQAEAALEAARAQAADARARLALSEEQLSKTRVRAPFGGVVAQRQTSVGDVVAPGAPLFTVIDPSRLQFEGAVPAARLGEARPGAPVELAVTGFEGRTFRGEIERVAPAVDTATGQVRAFVDVPNEDGSLISGLYAQGRVAARTDVALAAPASAVDATSTPPTVMRVSDGRVEKVAVRLGIRDDASGVVALDAGVSEGDVLVLGSARAALPEGAPVRVARERAGRRPPDGKAGPQR